LLFVKILNFLTFIILANEKSALQMPTSTGVKQLQHIMAYQYYLVAKKEPVMLMTL
jgi:hypothetical protein